MVQKKIFFLTFFSPEKYWYVFRCASKETGTNFWFLDGNWTFSFFILIPRNDKTVFSFFFNTRVTMSSYFSFQKYTRQFYSRLLETVFTDLFTLVHGHDDGKRSCIISYYFRTYYGAPLGSVIYLYRALNYVVCALPVQCKQWISKDVSMYRNRCKLCTLYVVARV